MKYLLKLITVLIILVSCQNETTNTNVTAIEGIINDDFKNQELFLQYINNDSLFTKSMRIDSNGKFRIQINNIHIPVEAILTMDTTNYTPNVYINSQFFNKFLFQFGSNSVPVQFGRKIDFRMFILEKGITKFDIKDSIYNSTIKNSKLNSELEELRKSLNPVMEKYNQHKSNTIDVTNIEDLRIIDSLDKAYTKIWSERQVVYNSYILENPNSEISLFALKYKYGGINTDVLRLYERLSDSVKASDFGMSIKNRIANYAQRMKKQLSKYDTIPDFKLEDINKQEISIYDIKSKYILLDFWASWCGPCRNENKLISAYYNDFDKFDFQIIGVSVDDNEDKWRNALIEDNINWISLWDKNKKINDQFGIISYPTNFLLNDKFEIIETNISSEKLKNRLNELLK